MRDSTKTLKFNPDRALGFDQSRGVEFETMRDLHFDQDRDLLFNVDRELEIRTRGVIFRGYVCPVCGASVDEEDPKCNECGVAFVRSKPKAKKKVFKRSPKSKSRSKKSSKKTRRTGNQRRIFQCPVCGQPMYVGTKVCPGCELEF